MSCRSHPKDVYLTAADLNSCIAGLICLALRRVWVVRSAENYSGLSREYGILVAFLGGEFSCGYVIEKDPLRNVLLQAVCSS